MQKTFDELYSELSQNPDFVEAFGEDKQNLQSFLEEVPDADRQIEQLFGVTNASATLKKKETTDLPAEGEGSSLPSLSVGQPEAVVEPAPMGGPVEVADIGPRPGMKRGTVGSQSPSYQIIFPQYEKAYQDILDQLKKSQPNSGLLNAQLKQFSDLYNQLEQDDTVNKKFNDVMMQVSTKFSPRVERGLITVAPKTAATLSAPSLLGAPEQVKKRLEAESKFEYIRGEKFRRGESGELIPVMEPLNERQRAVESYLTNYLIGNADVAQAQEVTSAFDVGGFLDKTNFYVPTAITHRGFVEAKGTFGEKFLVPGKVPLVPGGPFELSKGGDVFVDPNWVERQAERLLSESGLLSESIFNNINRTMRDDYRRRGITGEPQINREDAKAILLQQATRVLSQEVDRRLLFAQAEKKLADKGIYFETVQREQSKELADYQRTLTDEITRSVSALRADFANRLTPFYNSYKTKVDDLTAQYKALLDTELNDPELSTLSLKNRKALIDGDYLKAYATATAEWLEQKEAIEKEFQTIATNVQMEDALRRQEKEKYFQDKYGAKFDELKSQFEDAVRDVQDDVYDLRTFGKQFFDVIWSRTGSMYAGISDALTAAVGVENNFLADNLKYYQFVEKENNVAVGSFSDAVERSGFFSSDAVRTGILSVAQQVPNMTAGIIAGLATANPYVAGGVMWGLDSAEQAGHNYREKFEETGSIRQAEDVAKTTWKTQLLLAPLYTVEALPYVKGGLGKIGRGRGVVGTAKKAGLAVLAEQLPEWSQTLGQEYTSYTFRTPEDEQKNFGAWFIDNGYDAFLDVLPASVAFGVPAALGQQVSEIRTESKKERVMEALGRMGLVDMITTINPVVGQNGLQYIAEQLYRWKAIDLSQMREMKQVIADIVETSKNTKGVIRDVDVQRYYVQVAIQKKSLENALGSEKGQALSETQKTILQDRIADMDAQLKAIASNKDRRFSKIVFKKGGDRVFSNESVDLALSEAESGKQSWVSDVADSEDITLQIEDSQLKKRFDDFVAKRKAAREERQARRAQEEQAAIQAEQPFRSVGPQTITGLSAERTQAGVGVTVDQTERVGALRQKYQDPTQTEGKRIDDAARLQPVLDEVTPGVKIVLLEDEEYRSLAEKQGYDPNTNGQFYYERNADGTYTGEIYININRSTDNTVAHEVAHPLLISAVGSNPEKFNQMAQAISTLLPDSKLKQSMEEFVADYFDFQKGEEFLAQLAAVVRDGGRGDLSLGTMQKVAITIAKFISDITGGRVDLFKALQTKADIVDFFNGLSRTLQTGQVDQRARQMGAAQPAQQPAPGQQPAQQPAQQPVEAAQPEGGAVRSQNTGAPQLRPLPEGLEIVDGWYSPIEKRILETKTEKQSANKWLTIVGSKDEAIYTGVKGWLESKKPTDQVTKQEILDWMKGNRVQIEETSTQDLREDDGVDRTKYSIWQLPGPRSYYTETLIQLLPRSKRRLSDEELEELKMFQRLAPQDMSQEQNKRYSELQARHTTHIAEKDYESSHFAPRNILAHIRRSHREDVNGKPVLFVEEIQSDWAQEGRRRGFISDTLYKELEPLLKQRSELLFEMSKLETEADRRYRIATEKYENYQDELFGSEPDSAIITEEDEKRLEQLDRERVMAYRERYTPEALEEGKKAEEKKAELRDKYKQIDDKILDINRSIHRGTPAGPFVTETNNWTKLAVKFILRDAFEQGMETIAWTTGEQQNDRYNLSKQVDEITYSKRGDGTYQISASKDEIQVFSYRTTEDKLEDYVGKEIARKIIDGEGEVLSAGSKEEGTYMELGKVLSGVDLKVGGKGMKAFYDDIVPSVFKAVVKELTGQSIEISTVEIPGEGSVLVQQGIQMTPELDSAIRRGIARYQKPAGGSQTSLQTDQETTTFEQSKQGTSRGQIPNLKELGTSSFERLVIEKAGTELGSLGEQAAKIAQRFRSPIPEYLWGPKGAEVLEQSSKELRKWAKEQGAYITPAQLNKAVEKSKLARFPSGNESDVYLGSEGRYVYKVSNAGIRFNFKDKANNWRRFFQRLVAHNILFDDSRYDVLGFTEKDGGLAIILRQPAVEMVRGLNIDEVYAELEPDGFTQDEQKKWSMAAENAELGVRLEDLHEGNVVLNTEGVAVFIDPVIDFLEGSSLQAQIIESLESDSDQPPKGVFRSQRPNQTIEQLFNSHPSPEIGFERALREGYNFKQIQATLDPGVQKGQGSNRILPSSDYPPFVAAQRKIFDEAFQSTEPLAKRVKEAQDYVNSQFETWGRDAEDVYFELRAADYTEYEAFLAFAKDGLYPDEAKAIFGNDYRQTIEKILNTESLIPALDRITAQLGEDSRNLHVQMRAAEIVDIMKSLGLGVIEPGIVAQAFLEYLESKNVPTNMTGFVTMLKEALDKNSLDPDIAANMVQKAAQLFSFGGRMLQLARGFAKQDPIAIIEKKMNAEGIVLTAKQKETLRDLVNEVKAAEKQHEEDIQKLKGEVDLSGDIIPDSFAWTDDQFRKVDQSRKRILEAHSKLSIFLSDRKVVLWNEKYVAGMKKGLLSPTTVVLSFLSNLEILGLSRLFPGRTVAYIRDRIGRGDNIRSMTFSRKNAMLAWTFSRRQTRDSVWNSFRYGNINTNVQLEKYFDSAGSVDFFKDPQWLFAALKTLIYNSTGKNIRNMSQEELADAFNLTLTKAGEKGLVELRDGVSYSMLRSFVWTFNSGVYAAVMGSNPAYYLTTGPFATELTGRLMAFGGDVAFGNLAAKRAMIDYISWMADSKVRFQDGVLTNHLQGKNGKLDEQALRALCTILDSYSALRQPFEQQGLKRTLMADNALTNFLSKYGANAARKKARELYVKNRSDIAGSTAWREVRRQFSGQGVGKLGFQTLDVFLSTLMPFVTVPTNLVGQLVAKALPPVAGLKYFYSEWEYSKAKAEFEKKWPESKKLESENQRVAYEKAKIDLFFKKRQVTYDLAQLTNSFVLFWYAQSAVAAGALTVRGDEEKEKLKLTVGLKSAGYNFTKHMAYLEYRGLLNTTKFAIPGTKDERPGEFEIWYKKQNKKRDIIISTTNLGFIGATMNIHQQNLVYQDAELEARAAKYGLSSSLSAKEINQRVPKPTYAWLNDNIMATALMGSLVNNLPALQGVDRAITAITNSAKGTEAGNDAFLTWLGDTFATTLAVYFPGIGATFSKGRAEYPQSVKDIFPGAEDDWTTTLGYLSLEVVQRLNPKYAFTEELENEFYKARIGIFGEDLSKRVTLAEPGTIPAFVQAMLDPFQVAPEGMDPVVGDQYRSTVTIMSALIEFATLHNQINGRDYPYKMNGKKASSFFAAASHPQPNEFEYENQNATQKTQPIPYKMPNDLYRRYLQTRGVYVARSFRNTGFVKSLEDARTFIQAQAESAASNQDWEKASEEISKKINEMFDLYDKTMTGAIKQFELEYIGEDGVDATPESKKMPKISRNGDIREMIKRNLFLPVQVERLKEYGLSMQQ